MGSRFEDPDGEPLFRTIQRDDPRMLDAHRLAAESIGRFQGLVATSSAAVKCAKLRFRDPDESERLGEDQFFFLWLSDVRFHEHERIFSGMFFEVPPGFEKWHQVGKRLGFDPEDVFDWMVVDGGRLAGGFTLRVTRECLPEAERAAYDRYIGVESYESL
jgi:uncharacterized protein YegJ (DUF2314 family)